MVKHMSKPLFFKCQSPIQSFKPDTGAANILGDFQRLPKKTFINGQALNETFNNLDDIKKFFNDMVLKNYEGDKEVFVQKLMLSFHQGGLMHPVRVSMTFILGNKSLLVPSNEQSSQLNIISTHEGFTVQEIQTATKCYCASDNIEEWENFEKKFPDGIIPDEGQQFVYQAQVTFDVSLKNENLNISNFNPSLM